MQTYRIEETNTGWAMFQSRRTCPAIEAGTKEELLKKAAHLIAVKQASIRIENSNGTFQELRFKGENAFTRNLNAAPVNQP